MHSGLVLQLQTGDVTFQHTHGYSRASCRHCHGGGLVPQPDCCFDSFGSAQAAGCGVVFGCSMSCCLLSCLLCVLQCNGGGWRLEHGLNGMVSAVATSPCIHYAALCGLFFINSLHAPAVAFKAPLHHTATCLI